MKPKAILFDLDGTLIDTEILYQKAWKEAARILGFPLSEQECLALRSLDRRFADIEFAKRFNDEEAGPKLRAKRDELMGDYLVSPKPGAKELALFLKEKGIPFCVCSASSRETIKRNLAKARLDRYFQTLFSAKEVPHGKPFPDVYVAACKSLGVSPGEAIAVEDAPNGFKSALAAGLSVVYAVDLTEPDSFIEEHAYKIVHRLDEIIPFLESEPETI